MSPYYPLLAILVKVPVVFLVLTCKTFGTPAPSVEPLRTPLSRVYYYYYYYYYGHYYYFYFYFYYYYYYYYYYYDYYCYYYY